jgi:small subunit ribosomal protein S8
MNKSVRDLLVSLKNYSSSNLRAVCTEYSSKKLSTLDALYKEGYIQSYFVDKSNFKIYVTLRYFYNKPAINKLKILSKTINSKNISLKHISKISNRNSTLFISTTKGIQSSLDCKKKSIGGKTFFFS